MPQYLEIAVNVPQVMGAFHYHLPQKLEGKVQPGHLVVVPFGHQRVQGVVLREIPEPAVPETRPVEGLVDGEVVLTPVQMALAKRLAESTLAPLAACTSLMVPSGLSQQADTRYSLLADTDETSADHDLSPLQKRVVRLLQQRGPLRGRQIDRALPRLNWRRSAQALLRRGLLESESVLPSVSVRPKTVRTVQLASVPAAVRARWDEVGRAGTAAQARRQEILRFLLEEPGPVAVSQVYAASEGNLDDLRRLSSLGLVLLGETEVWRDPLDELSPALTSPPRLTRHQAEAWKAVRAGLEAARSGEEVPPFLLHGVTGSGKTEIYLHAVAEVLARGKQAIVLVPEIALTPQTVRRFVARFPGQVGLIHSQLSEGERYDTWRRARTGDLAVVVGPRSALFTPFPELALIVVDEAHDDSYYQFESPPHYHAREASVAYARLAGAVCVLGSATPDITSHARAVRGDWQLLELPARILAHQETVRAQADRLGRPSSYRPLGDEAAAIDLPPVRLVDMRMELKEGNRSIFSRALQSALERVLGQEEQAILFLNRRGAATYVFCRDCGLSLRCPRCELPLTYHRVREALVCHHCNYRRNMPNRCPRCRSERIRHYGTGTERVESELTARYPGVRTLRWDRETTRQKGAHTTILRTFANHQADVLVGTQMLAKGLDLPRITLVGVVLADVGMNLPDYRAGERTFQVLAQVAGRAGRSPLGGQVILQTFQPDHYVIQAAAHHDYRSFYEQELAHRRRLGYPPFTRLVRMEYRHHDAEKAEAQAVALGKRIRRWLKQDDRRATLITGPAPAFFSRLEGQYRWQIILRGPDPVSFLRGRNLRGWRVEVNPPSLL